MAASEAIRVLELEARAIDACAARLKTPAGGQAFAQAIAAIEECLAKNGKLIVTGLGKSGKVAQKIAATLSSTGSLALYLHPTEGLHGDLGIVTERDVVLAISYTGNTEELLQLAPSLKARGARLIALAGNGASRLVQTSDFWLDGSVEQEACPHNLAPTASTTLALALGDAIAVTLMKRRGFAAEEFARNHPAGSLGRRLNWRVHDVMHSGATVAVVAPDAPMDEVIVRSTEKKLGAVLVIEGTRLAGIITDGDLRRALSHREKFFQMKAREVMTASPVTVTPETMAADALALMRDRPSQIAVLPVIDSAGNWKGLVRLHDLVRSL